LAEENSHYLQQRLALEKKIIRYDSLKEVVRRINENLQLDIVADSLTSLTFSLIALDKGACILYMVDSSAQGLSLISAKKQDRSMIFRGKNGDIFDLWVLKHASPLLIENTHQDFRFDPDKFNTHDLRPIFSLISVPFLVEHKFLGILRLDSPQENFYSQDDLRLLLTIADLGAVALENSLLFQEAKNLAIHDSLTALYTKRYFMERLKEECVLSLKNDSVFSLLMIDIDYFKNYNDTFGHSAADIVLKEISLEIKRCFGGLNPIVSRFGGEEFCVILPGTAKDKANILAEQLRLKTEEKIVVLRRKETKITVSIGVASFPADASADEDLIMKADLAMYQAKQSGRNRVCSA
jgi:diguanylate cyclase (GGDEF)-like protein